MKKTRKKTSMLFLFFFSTLVLIYFSLYYVYIKYVIPDNNSKYETIQAKTTDSSHSTETENYSAIPISDIIEQVSKSVVGISKLQTNNDSIFSNNFNAEVGSGTGIIVSENGYILSNSHVTGEKYSSCYVTLEDGNTYNAKVVWSDTDLDLSICKISATSLLAVKLGDSASVKSRQFCFCNW